MKKFNLGNLVVAVLLTILLASCSSGSNDDEADTTAGTTDATNGASDADGTTDDGTGVTDSATDGSTDSGTDGSTDGGTSDGGSTAGGELSNDTSAIAGLWDITDAFGDVAYIEFLPNGFRVDWNYLGDSFEAGDNCYSRVQTNVKNLGNDRYEFYDDVDDVATVTVANGMITITDDFETLVYPAATGISSTDFNLCV